MNQQLMNWNYISVFAICPKNDIFFYKVKMSDFFQFYGN